LNISLFNLGNKIQEENNNNSITKRIELFQSYSSVGEHIRTCVCGCGVQIPVVILSYEPKKRIELYLKPDIYSTSEGYIWFLGWMFIYISPCHERAIYINNSTSKSSSKYGFSHHMPCYCLQKLLLPHLPMFQTTNTNFLSLPHYLQERIIKEPLLSKITKVIRVIHSFSESLYSHPAF
jgi:hypothetical protein